jgi:hypothetical protein
MKWTAAKLRPRVHSDHVSLDVAINQQVSSIAVLAAPERRVEVLNQEAPESPRARIGAG